MVLLPSSAGFVLTRSVFGCDRDVMRGLGGIESVHAGVTPAGACESEMAGAQEEPRQPVRPVGQCHALSLPVSAQTPPGRVRFLFTALYLRKACYSRVTQASLPQLGSLQAFQTILVAPSPGKPADPVHQLYIKAAGRACCWSEK